MAARQYLRRNLFLCAVLHGFNHYLLIFFKPLYPELAVYFNLHSVYEVTTRLTLIYLGYGISNLLTGIFAARLNLKKLLFAGMALLSLATMSMALLGPADYPLAIILVFCMGLGGGVYHPAANTMITALAEERTGRSLGTLSIGSALGFVLAPIIGTYVGRDSIGFKMLFLVSGLLALFFSFIFIFFFKDKLSSSPSNIVVAGNNYSSKLDYRRLGPLIVLLLLPATFKEIINWSYYEITPFWVKAGFSCGIGIEWVQLMAYLPGLIFQPLTGLLCDRVGHRRMALLTIFLSGVGISLLTVPLLPVIWLGLVLFGIGMSSSTVANEAFLASLVTARERPFIYGIVLSLALGVGGLIGGLSGLVVDYFGKQVATGYSLWFLIMACAIILSLVSYFFIKKRD